MAPQIPLDPGDRAYNPFADTARGDSTHEVAPDIAYRRLAIANVVFCGRRDAGDRGWVLVDAGVMGSTNLIRHAAEERFGSEARPGAIVLTHGHFDHTGALEALVEHWDVPVYAHTLECPYLNGTASYPPADPTVGGGVMAFLSPLYPRGPVDVSRVLKPLPGGGHVPHLPGWRWFHTPGHTPGHVSLWREDDRTIIAGDAFITTRQESAYAVAMQEPEMHGPPMYYTTDWGKAKASVGRLAGLNPDCVVTGHGQPMRGEKMRAALHELAQDFDQIAVPASGRYVENPASAQDGGEYRQP